MTKEELESKIRNICRVTRFAPEVQSEYEQTEKIMKLILPILDLNDPCEHSWKPIGITNLKKGLSNSAAAIYCEKCGAIRQKEY